MVAGFSHQLTELSGCQEPELGASCEKKSSCRVVSIHAGRCELRAFGIEVKELLAGAIFGEKIFVY